MDLHGAWKCDRIPKKEGGSHFEFTIQQYNINNYMENHERTDAVSVSGVDRALLSRMWRNPCCEGIVEGRGLDQFPLSSDRSIYNPGGSPICCIMADIQKNKKSQVPSVF